MIKEVTDRIRRNKPEREGALRMKRAKNIAFGAIIGTAAGAVAGILLAPKSGKKTRKALARRTEETFDKTRENVSETSERISRSVEEKAAKLRSAAEEYAKAAKKAVQS